MNGEWQPIDTAPKDDEPVLVWYPQAFRGRGGCYVALWQDGAWWAAVNAFKFKPSHWMPLPVPPIGEA